MHVHDLEDSFLVALAKMIAAASTLSPVGIAGIQLPVPFDLADKEGAGDKPERGEHCDQSRSAPIRHQQVVPGKHATANNACCDQLPQSLIEDV